MRKAYNYTTVRTREKRIYSIAGTKISSVGYTQSFLVVLAGCLVLFNIFGIILCAVTGEFLYNPIKSATDVDLTFLVIFIGGPIGLACILNNAKIQSYRLIDWCIMRIKPQKCYDERGRIISLKNVKVDGFVERIL